MRLPGHSEKFSGPDGEALIICPPSYSEGCMCLYSRILFSWDGTWFHELTAVETSGYDNCFQKISCANPHGGREFVVESVTVPREPKRVRVNGQVFTSSMCPAEIDVIPKPRSSGSRHHLRPQARTFALAGGPPAP